jgi:tetratricopeptide (TPR) repeat protein
MATFFTMWFVFAISPVLNLILPLDMSFAERWLYVPMIGLLGLLGGLIIEIKILRRNINKFLAIGLLIILALMTRTLYRNMDWKDGYTLYSHDIEIESESFDLQNNLGVEKFRKGEYEDAFLHFEKSVELQPRWIKGTTVWHMNIIRNQ